MDIRWGIRRDAHERPGWKPVSCKEKAGCGREGGVMSGRGSAIRSRTHERRAHVSPWCAPLSMMNPPA